MKRLSYLAYRLVLPMELSCIITRPPPTVFNLETRSEERRVGKECRSLCDWSSDVCSSDLAVNETAILFGVPASAANGVIMYNNPATPNGFQFRNKIGRASCRERV